MIEYIEQLQRELVDMRDYHQRYLDRRARRKIVTATDTIMTRQQETLAKTLDLLEAIKVEKMSEAEAEGGSP